MLLRGSCGEIAGTPCGVIEHGARQREERAVANVLNKLSAKAVQNAAPGKHGDGGGLFLMVSKAGGKSWTFFYSFSARRREMALGPLADLSLAQAREKARELRETIRGGVDPLEARNAAPADDGDVAAETFGEAVATLLNSLEEGWKNPKHRQQWRNTLKTYCAPFWDKPVAAVDTDDVLGVLSPIWLTKNETASRLRGRIERVLGAAKVRGKRAGENPARWKEHLDVLLPKRKKKSLRRHHPALPSDQVTAFIDMLRTRRSIAARALEFLILTAGRTGEVLGIQWKEIDLEAKLWTVPAVRMKMGVEHRVPLSGAALAVLTTMSYSNTGPDAFVFPGMRPRKPLSNMAMEMILRREGYDAYTVHGFRSTFRDWCGEETEYPREIAEAALAHSVGNEVERAYRRGDALAKRRALMDDWANYCLPTQAAREAE
jgi:integrase